MRHLVLHDILDRYGKKICCCVLVLEKFKQLGFHDHMCWRRGMVSTVSTTRNNCPHIVERFPLLGRRRLRKQQKLAGV